MASGDKWHIPGFAKGKEFSMFLRHRCRFSELRNLCITLPLWDWSKSLNLSYPQFPPVWNENLYSSLAKQIRDGHGGARGSSAMQWLGITHCLSLLPILVHHPTLSYCPYIHPWATQPLCYPFSSRLSVCFRPLPWQRRQWSLLSGWLLSKRQVLRMPAAEPWPCSLSQSLSPSLGWTQHTSSWRFLTFSQCLFVGCLCPF